jgi:serine/threonine protein phosphatase PrpC
MMLPLQISQRSCTGARDHNEDCVGVERVGHHWCMVLSDGAGGHRDGALASRLVVDRILEGFRSRPPVDGPDLGELVLDAHDGVIAAQRARGATDRAGAMHATVVVLLIDAERRLALWSHVGDSRLYLLREGRAEALTRDDSVLQWMVDAGFWQPGQLQQHPQRNQLMAALGADEGVEPHVSADPFELHAGDAFLLCSDGWWGSLSNDEIERMRAGSATPDQWLDAMVGCTNGRADPRQDNFSAIGCWIGTVGDKAAP